VRGRLGVYNVMYAYKEEAPGFYAGRLALQLVDSLLPPELQGVEGLDVLFDRRDASYAPLEGPFDVNEAIGDLERLGRRSGFGPTTGSIVQEAIKRDIPVMRLGDEAWFNWVTASVSSASGRASPADLPDRRGGRGPQGPDQAAAGGSGPARAAGRGGPHRRRGGGRAARMRFSVVVKPLDGNHGRGVSIDLKTEDEIRRGFELAAPHGRRVIVEQFYPGHDHRSW
jgi:cyanophycin synthetase